MLPILRGMSWVGRGIVSASKWAWGKASGLWGTSAAVIGKSSVSKWFWRSLDLASWGFLAYDALSDDDSVESLMAGNDYFSDIVLDKAVTMALSERFADVDAIRYAFSNASLSILSKEEPSSFLKGLTYAALVDYLDQVANPETFLYSQEESKAVLNEADKYIQALYPVAYSQLGDGVGALSEFLAALDFDEMSNDGRIFARKQVDFLVHFFKVTWEFVNSNSATTNLSQGSPSTGSQGSSQNPNIYNTNIPS